MHRTRLSWIGRSKSNQAEQAGKAQEAQTNIVCTKSNDNLANKKVGIPGEIWDMIWCLIIDSTPPRIVEIRHKQEKINAIFTSPSPIPPVLQICARSRALAMRRWKLCFATKGECAKIFFDYKTDELYFGREFRSVKLFKEQVGEEDRKNAKSTGFASRTVVDGRIGRAMYLDMLASERNRERRIWDMPVPEGNGATRIWDPYDEDFDFELLIPP